MLRLLINEIGRSLKPYKKKLKAGMVIENILAKSALPSRYVFYLYLTKLTSLIKFNCKTIIYTSYPPYVSSFYTICLYISYILAALKPLIRKNIRKRTNNIVAYSKTYTTQSMLGLSPIAKLGFDNKIQIYKSKDGCFSPNNIE